MGQRATVLHDIKNEIFDWYFSQRRSVVQLANDFIPEHSQVVDVLAKGFPRELELDQMMQEGPEALYDFLAGRKVFRESHPSSWPLVEVFAEWQQA